MCANFGFAALAIGPVRLARRLAQRREAGLAMQCSTLPPADIMHCSRVTEAQLVEPNLRIIDAAWQLNARPIGLLFRAIVTLRKPSKTGLLIPWRAARSRRHPHR